MDINSTSPQEVIATVELIEDIEVLRGTATDLGLTFSGNTGAPKLKEKIFEAMKAKIEESTPPAPTETPTVQATPTVDAANLMDDILGGADDEPIEVAKAIPAGPSIEELLKMDPKKVADPALRRQVIRAQALRLVRVNITNVDPSEAQLEGALITAVNKYTGKVSKFVPFGEASENGWHVPAIILKQMKNQKFVLRREIKGGKFGVKKYSTKYVNKYQIEYLPDLTKEEMAELAAHQRAAGTIDKSVA